MADSTLTRRRFMLRSAQVGAGVAAGSLVSPLPGPAFHGSEHRALAPPGLPAPAAHERRLLALRRLARPVLRRALGAGEEPLRVRQQRRRPHLPQLAAAHDARGRSAQRPPGPVPQRRARAGAGAAPVRLAAVERARRLARGRPAVPQPGMGREHGHPRGRDGQVDRPQGGRGADVRVAGAGRAAPPA